MAINLYKECRGASDKECQLINRVVINRMHSTNKDACSIIFEKNQFSWTKRYPKNLNFASYDDMIAYYRLNDSVQLMRAFDNVDKSRDEQSTLKTSIKMNHYYDRSIHPKWARKMPIAYRTKYFVFLNA
jgi:hypothetical protein